MNEPQIFQCSLCPFYATYDRFDSKYQSETKKDPSITIDLLEQVYLLRDPFIGLKDKDKEDQTKISSLIIGSICSVCSRSVCIHSDCSIFYTRRFCLQCIAKYRYEFPREILDEIGEKKLEKFINEEYEHVE